MNLDDITIFEEFDLENVRGSIELLPKQIEQTWQEVSDLKLPTDFNNSTAFVFSGMGGSALGAYVVKHLYQREMTLPFEIKNDYTIPSYVNDKTVVFIQSYSGTTEESLAALEEARKQKAKIFVVATGGFLLDRAKQLQLPYFQVNPKFNPSNQPRMGVGYSIFALITFLSKIGVIKLDRKHIDELLASLASSIKLFAVEVPQKDNLAKQVAQGLHNKIPIFIAGEHLIGAAHASRNQFNENAKTIAFYLELPDADHFVLEGLQFPSDISKHIYAIFYHADGLSEKLKTRTKMTAQVFRESGIEATEVSLMGETGLSQVMNGVLFGSFLSFYCAILNGIDPVPVVNVENFKKMIA